MTWKIVVTLQWETCALEALLKDSYRGWKGFLHNYISFLHKKLNEEQLSISVFWKDLSTSSELLWRLPIASLRQSKLVEESAFIQVERADSFQCMALFSTHVLVKIC